MNKVKTAMRPTFRNVPAQTPPEVSEKTLSEDERFLASMANSPGWLVLGSYANSLITDLENTNRLAIANGQDFAEIGKNAIVISLAKDIVEKILNKVSDAKEAVESNGSK